MRGDINTSCEKDADAAPTAPPLIVLSRAPYAGFTARSALDMVMAFAVFAQNPVVLLCGPGVLALTESQNPTLIERKSLRKIIDSFPLYDVEHIYVCASSLRAWGVEPDRLPACARIADAHTVCRLRAEAGHVVSL